MTAQRSREWYIKRLGKITASEISRIFSPRGMRSYAAQLRREMDVLARIQAGEEIDLNPAWSGAATRWGIETEEKARAYYEFRHDADVEIVDFIVHARFPFVGCSPDFLCRPGGGEIKCPYKTENHLKTIRSGRMPDQHIPQVQALSWIGDLEWVDYISYDPRLGAEDRYFEIRVFRDQEYINRMESKVIEFWDYFSSGDDTLPDIQAGEIPALF